MVASGRGGVYDLEWVDDAGWRQAIVRRVKDRGHAWCTMLM